MFVVTGIGGCGKTQLVLKFLHVYSSRFVTSFIVDGSSESRIRADIIRNVRSLGTSYSQMGFDECLLFLSQPLPTGMRMILYDNVDDPDIDIISLIPHGNACAVTLTSRNRSISSIGPDAHLELDKMSMDEAVELLLQGTSPALITDEVRKGATEIAEKLDCLPIALQQARGYMHETRCSASAYLDRLRTSRTKLLTRELKYERGARYLSTYAAFNASYKRFDQQTQKLLWLLSFFHWSKFPLDLITLAAEHDFAEYESPYTSPGEKYHTGKAVLEEIFFTDGSWDVTNLDELLVSLQSYSLVTVLSEPGARLLNIHPIVHEWVKSTITNEEKIRFQWAAVVLLVFGTYWEDMPNLQYLIGHVMDLSYLWNQLQINEATALSRILIFGGAYS
ncbi:hypothetical protein M408DRAFT_77651, partial [Serendipita vermifera MAFF 305830]